MALTEDLNVGTLSTSSPSSLPIIDISTFLNSHASLASRQTTAACISAACQDFGFFYLTGHGIPKSRLDEIVELSRQFFTLPVSEKMKIKRHDAGGPEGGDGARGYQIMRENITLGRRDVQEAVDFYREWDHAPRADGTGGPTTRKTLQGSNLWPQEPKEYREVYLDYINQCQKVGKILVRAMGVALGLALGILDATENAEDEEVFVRNTDRSFWAMRAIGYPKLDAKTTEYSCGEHTDYGCITLLLSCPTSGALQVLLKDTKTWLTVDPVPGAFVVNIGDMVERWTNGLWKSTRHRVIHRTDGYRVSIPFFYEPNFTAIVRPLKRCVERTDGVPLHEEDIMYGDYLLNKIHKNFYGGVRARDSIGVGLSRG